MTLETNPKGDRGRRVNKRGFPMKRAILAAAMTALLAGSAYAADLPVRHMPVKAPVAVPYYNWTGFYIGVNAGGAFGRISQAGFGSDSLNGFAGGAQIGYNWQVNNFVFGVETDFQGSSQKISESGFDPLLGGAFSSSGRLNYFGTIRGRLGIAQDRWLVYVTGGYAYQNIKVDFSSPFGAASSSSTRGGWTLGGGVEYAFAGPWTLGVEYLYLDSGNRDWNLFGQNVSLRSKNNIVRAKLNYRF
ncbi:MAG TPA: outer membrane protein [Pseudolabrys sp.]|nr:outer membrane protein [Pseudolabrys sp.]